MRLWLTTSPSILITVCPSFLKESVLIPIRVRQILDLDQELDPYVEWDLKDAFPPYPFCKGSPTTMCIDVIVEDWPQTLLECILHGRLPGNRKERIALRRLSTRYTCINRLCTCSNWLLYDRFFKGILLRCLSCILPITLSQEISST
ncbi:hypothetical protein AMTR_s00013p00258570 [Amborella trichopoda]|uniref:Uncharacterized protein n=1 Tax=Amborella trichopoda TaxID=13333 RepID=W1PS50_AMBTC|nr:hypothetical protein AMTR_s00013p00258570 [Amborella trichopoda]